MAAHKASRYEKRKRAKQAQARLALLHADQPSRERRTMNENSHTTEHRQPRPHNKSSHSQHKITNMAALTAIVSFALLITVLNSEYATNPSIVSLLTLSTSVSISTLLISLFTE